jgi:cysteine synthase
MELQTAGRIEPGKHNLVWPSTGNYGIGGAWVAPRMGYSSTVILPEEMSQERFDIIASYGSACIKTPGCESNVKEIYDKARELRADPQNRVLNQFAEFGNYRFHYAVTGPSILELARDLAKNGVGRGKVSAFVSAMGSAGTIAAGEKLKQADPATRTVGLEPVQCSTLYDNGFGGHDIQGIGDKHVTWIHNTDMMDVLFCIDDMDCKKGLQLLAEEAGGKVLEEAGVPGDTVRRLPGVMGISSVCNLIGAIKTARYYQLGPDDLVVTVATDAKDRYHSVLDALTASEGAMDAGEARRRLESIFHGATLDPVREGTPHAKDCWFNLKYYTWVEQQGKTVDELLAQRDPGFWLREQALVEEIDKKVLALRGR